MAFNYYDGYHKKRRLKRKINLSAVIPVSSSDRKSDKLLWDSPKFVMYGGKLR